MPRETRRLALVAAALAVVLLVGRTLVTSLYDVDALQRRAESLQRSLQQEAASRPDPGVAREAASWASALRQRLDAALPALRWARPEAFDVPAGESPDLRFLQVLREQQEQLVQRARYEGRSVPAGLGMPVPNPTGLEDVLAALRALSVVQLVVDAALDAGVEAVDEIALPPSPARAASSGFLRAHGVAFDLQGAPRAVRDTLASIVSLSPAVLLDDVELTALDADGERVRCRFTAAVLDVDEQAPVRAEGER